MPSTPTTKSQVQAYKFVLRRMQSALVRKDAVMLHDPMRTHTRATVVGVALGAVGLVGFLVWGLLSPAPTLPTDDSVVISKESGTVYVMLQNPRKLIPTFNLASARLILLAQHEQNGGQGQQPKAPTAAAAEVPKTTVVSDKDLQGVAKGRLMGIQNGPELLPGPDQRISDDWAVCDRYVLNKRLVHPDQENIVKTTVLAGVPSLGEPLGERGLLVRAQDKKTYLIYHLDTGPNATSTDTVRAEVDLNNSAVNNAMDLGSAQPRVITTALFNSIPSVRKLEAPNLAGRGGAATPNVKGFTVGTVFKIERAAANGDDEYYVQERGGIQKVKPTTADLVRFNTNVQGGEEIKKVQPADLDGVTRTAEINEESTPATVPAVLTAVTKPVACLGWSIPAGQTVGHTTVYVNSDEAGVPIPKDKVPPNYDGVPISSPSVDGLKVDFFYMPPGRAAVIRGSSSPESYQTGPIALVSDRGVKFGVPDTGTAGALGLDNQRPAPDSIIKLLPNGAELNTRAVLQTYDSVAVPPGTYETTDPSSQANAPQDTGGQGGG